MTAERHDLTVEANGDVRCSCSFRADEFMFGRSHAKALGYAHQARPDAETIELLAFVTGRDSDVVGTPA